jgi:YfiH family protein
MPSIMHVEYDFTIEPKGLTRPLFHQVHGNLMVQVTDQNLSQLYQTPPDADGAITESSQLKLSVFTADCIPLLFFTEDPKGPIAVIHCGWRGALQNITSTLQDLWSEYLDGIHAIIGPCLEPCCFEVKKDLIAAFEDAGHQIHPYLISRDNKTFFHLSSFVIEEQLSFIKKKNIHTQDLRCTFCSLPQLPSYRRNKSTDPRIRGWLLKF